MARAFDNTFRDATLVYNHSRIIYNAGYRDKGSPYHGGSGDYAATVPKDEMLLGIDDRIFGSTGNGGEESTGMLTDVANWVAEKMGVPFLHSHYLRLYKNGSLFRNVIIDMEQPNGYFAKSWFGSEGVKDDLFKISVWFEFDDGNTGFTPTGATLERFLSGTAYKLARYRWNWQLRPSIDTANDYTAIFNLVAAANSGSERPRTFPNVADMEEWMRVFAFDRAVANWDSWTYNVGQNMYLYAPVGQRAKLLPWDIDFVLGLGDGPTTSLFAGGQDPVMVPVFGLPIFRRMMWRAYQDAANGPMLLTNYTPQLDVRRSMFLKNGITGLTAPTGAKTFFESRRNYILQQLRLADTPNFAITSNNGLDFTTNNATATLTGTAPIAVATIEINGIPYPLTWTTVTNWQTTVPLGPATNNLSIAGYDLRHQLVAGATDTIAIRYTGAVPDPRDWVVINEIMYHSLAPDADYIEIYNFHPSYSFDLSGFELRGVDFTFPAGTLIAANGYLVIAENKAAFGIAYDPILPVLGPFSGKLQNDGEKLRLVKPGVGGAAETVIDDVRYDNTAPWPLAADGTGPSLQLVDPTQDNWRAGNWLATATNDVNRATPGRANAGRSTLPAFPLVWLNEVLPDNIGGVLDNFSEREPWIELYNSDTKPVDLGSYFLSNDPLNPAKWQFPAGTTLGPKQFLLIWADGEPGESTPSAIHANFRLSSGLGLVTLSRAQSGSFAAMDYIKYEVTTPGASFGSFPDGEPRDRRMLFIPTADGANNGTPQAAQVFINEWLATPQSILADPADGQFDSWFELYNAGANTVDLSGYYLTDSLAQNELFKIPSGFSIAPGEFRLIWADGEPNQNGPGRDLHVNFTVKSQGGQIGLYTPLLALVDTVTTTAQSPNISEGRFPDGAGGPFVVFASPTPAAANKAQFANQAPVLAVIDDQTVSEGQRLQLRAVASDADVPAQTLVFSMAGGPEGALLDPQTGAFDWTPSEAQGPGTYAITLRVTDNGTPPRATSRTFKVTVTEANRPPVLSSIADRAVDESALVAFSAVASDPDLPAQVLKFSLDPGSPAGAVIDPGTGEFSWIPDESQGPGTYPIVLRVTDNGVPPLSAAIPFTITVREVNNAPVITPIPAQALDEGATFRWQIEARDPDSPPAPLSFTLESGPPGLTVDRDTGLITWVSDESAGPHDYKVSVNVSEPGGTPSASVSFIIGVAEVNTAPVLESIPNYTVGPGNVLVFAIKASDADLPAQTLTFSAIGSLPPGAALDPVTGAFSWVLPADPKAGTNTITIRVTDDSVPPGVSEKSFNIVVRAADRVVINEIFHRPVAADAAFVELANLSAVNAVDLSGWRLEGYNFTFASGTLLSPNDFLSVAQNLAGFRAAYGANLAAVGNASVSLPVDGGLLRLVAPSVAGLPERVIDETFFSLSPPWPSLAAQGASLQLIDPLEDHRRVANWGAASGKGTNTPVSLLAMDAAWKYWQSSTDPGAAWNTPGYSDANWPSGKALLYVEDAALPAAKNTALQLGQTAYYFRTHFTFSGNTNGALLRTTFVVDDGAVVYLNGVEVYRLAMATGAVTQATFSTRTVGDAAFEGPFDFEAKGLVQGDNVLAVEVHQANATSSDIVFGAAVDGVTLSLSSFTPSQPNSVARDLPTFSTVWINEIMPNNTANVVDNAGDRDPWIELHNYGIVGVNLAGWTLSDSYTNLAKWAFPPGSSIPAGSFLLVWADGEAAESTTSTPHTSFRMRPDTGSIILSQLQNSLPTVVDYVNYQSLGPNQSFGGLRDDDPLRRQILPTPSPLAPNVPGGVERPAISISLNAAGQVTLSWLAASGHRYRIESSDDLASPLWVSAFEVAGSGSVESWVDSNPGGTKTRYYRIVVVE